MKMDSTKATAFIAKEIHMEREQAFLVVRGVPQAIMVGKVTHWKPA